MRLRGSIRVKRGFHLAFVFLAACRSASQMTPASWVAKPQASQIPADWCVAVNSPIDSAFAIAQARHLFDSTPVLVPQAVDRIVLRDSLSGLRAPEGFVVRLVPAARGALGGGGLVWVNAVTGCPILLIHYE